ncbi:hypothetical protein HMPREF1264_00793, partial [Corynebacterium sp. KPL1821]
MGSGFDSLMAHNTNLEALFLERHLEIFLFMSQSLWVKGQNVCLARRVAGVRFGLFEC